MTDTFTFGTRTGRDVPIPLDTIRTAAPAMLAYLRNNANPALDGTGPCWCSEQEHDYDCADLRAAVRPWWPDWHEWKL